MNIYKKTLLTLAGVGALGACVSERRMTGVVTRLDSMSYYIDINYDTFSDCMVQFERFSAKHKHIYDYVRVGDTLKFRTFTAPNRVDIDAELDSVNNRSNDDLIRIYNENRIRRRDGYRKIR